MNLTQYFEKSVEMTSLWVNSEEFLIFSKFCDQVVSSLKLGKKIIIFGNGGSCAEASHIAAEFVGKCVVDSGPLPAICLNDSSSAITAIANDWGYDYVFSRQLKALASRGDVVIGLSTSGTSSNVLTALSSAQVLGCVTSLWTSNRYVDNSHDVDYVFKAPTSSTPRAQELHLLMGHVLAEYVESI